MKLVIIDRDGVINEDSGAFIKSAAEWRPIEGSLEAIVRLKHAGFRVVVASNQSGLGQGLYDYDGLFAIHDKMARMLADLGAELDGVFFCPHAPDAGCGCRKPATGLLEDIARRLGGSVRGCPFIGDKPCDVRAALAAGAIPLLVANGNKIEESEIETGDIRTYANLSAAADALIADSATVYRGAERRRRVT